MLQRLSTIKSWTEFTRALESIFGPSPFDCPMADLFKLQQSGSASDYYLKFMSLANRSFGLPIETLLNCFLSGLHVEIRRDVVAQSPTSLLCTISFAKLYEDRHFPNVKNSSYIATPQYSHVSTQVHNHRQTQPQLIQKQAMHALLPTPLGPPLKVTNNVKKISPAEMQIRREKGLCYFCDDKFTFNNRCPNRQFLFLQLTDENAEDHNFPTPVEAE